jgi:hypothetical protein
MSKEQSNTRSNARAKRPYGPQRVILASSLLAGPPEEDFSEELTPAQSA